MQETVQRTPNYDVNFDLNIDLIKEVSKKSESKAVKSAAAYFRFLKYHSPDKLWGFSVDDVAFLFGIFAKKHFRLAEIAVTSENQNKGYGSFMLAVLFGECAFRGVSVITFRTSQQESSWLWYKKQRAQVVGVKNNDYEMEFRL